MANISIARNLLDATRPLSRTAVIFSSAVEMVAAIKSCRLQAWLKLASWICRNPPHPLSWPTKALKIKVPPAKMTLAMELASGGLNKAPLP